jgi:3-hydroxyacyl-CoA dehydrogenase
MSYEIKKVAVLGAGTMGSGIAAHLANAGIPSFLLDIVPNKLTPAEEKQGLTLQDKAVRNRLANAGLETALKASPAAFYSPKYAEKITTGNFEDDWDKLAECDWIVEVVVERLDIKRDVFKRVAEVRKPGSIISSNTSGIAIKQMGEGLGEEFLQHFLVTHFFNPVRYMKLLELVPHAQTLPEVMSFMQRFGEDVLGKGVIIGKDTPNFVGNRIGIYGFASTLKRMAEHDFSVEEVDAVLGKASGRPNSAAFRTSDLVGLDVSLHVARNVYDNALNDEMRDAFTMPDWIQQMSKNGLLGEKTGAGFYKKVKGADGKSQIMQLNPKTLEYVALANFNPPSVEEASRRSTPAKRIETLVYGESRESKFAWDVLCDTLLYTANRMPEIADDIVTVDQAMRWGYNWSLGPFETWDAIGPLKAVQRMRKEGRDIPEWVVQFVNRGQDFFYIEQNGRKKMWDVQEGRYKAIPERTDLVSLTRISQDKANVLRKNESASALDIGDGVICLEFHAKLNSIDQPMVALGMWALNELNTKDKWRGMVISNEADDFCAGANLVEVMMAGAAEKWKDIELGVKAFQDFCQAIKYSAKPVVVAPFGRSLGGGCEIPLAGALVRAHAETYMGLVEVGAGLIPGGGGNKEVLLRNIEKTKGYGGPFPPVQKTFEAIGFAKVSTSAAEAKAIGYLRPTDRITLSRERLITDAKADVLELANREGGYKAPTPPTFRLPGEGGRLAMEQAIDGFVSTKTISEHDAFIAYKLVYVLTGGNAGLVEEVTEQRLLDLEREAFVELCKAPKSQERMQYILTKGKPLRN